MLPKKGQKGLSMHSYNNAAESEIPSLFILHSPSLSKPGAYITHNAIQPTTVCFRHSGVLCQQRQIIASSHQPTSLEGVNHISRGSVDSVQTLMCKISTPKCLKVHNVRYKITFCAQLNIKRLRLIISRGKTPYLGQKGAATLVERSKMIEHLTL